MNCPICNELLPDDAIFCHKCTNQIACKECGKPLSVGGVICNYCGKSINKTNETANRFEFKEDKNSRSFTADFSDSTAGNVVETLAQLLTSNRYKLNTASSLPEYAEVPHEVADIVVPAENNQTKPIESNKGDLQLLNEIFQFRGDELYLHETELKGSSLANHIQRVVLLFLYRKYLLGEKSVSRSELTEFLNGYSYNTGNYRAWIASTNAINNNNQLSLCRSGIDEAAKYLCEVFDPNVKSTWKQGAAKKKSTNGSSSKETKSKTQNKTYKILGNLNFQPKGKKSLSEFMSKYNPKSGLEYNVLFVYYLERVMGEKGITTDHVYSCYKAVQQKFPSNLYQSIIDTNRRKGWLNTSNVNDIIITTNGENAVEYDLLNNK